MNPTSDKAIAAAIAVLVAVMALGVVFYLNFGGAGERPHQQVASPPKTSTDKWSLVYDANGFRILQAGKGIKLKTEGGEIQYINFTGGTGLLAIPHGGYCLAYSKRWLNVKAFNANSTLLSVTPVTPGVIGISVTNQGCERS